MNTTIDDAISAHISWLARFQNVLLGIDRERFDPQQISDPTLCAFGRWLQAHPDFTANAEHVKRVETLHQRFHEKAGTIAKLLGDYARHHVIETHFQQLSELSGQLVEILYEVKDQQLR